MLNGERESADDSVTRCGYFESGLHHAPQIWRLQLNKSQLWLVSALRRSNWTFLCLPTRFGHLCIAVGFVGLVSAALGGSGIRFGRRNLLFRTCSRPSLSVTYDCLSVVSNLLLPACPSASMTCSLQWPCLLVPLGCASVRIGTSRSPPSEQVLFVFVSN